MKSMKNSEIVKYITGEEMPDIEQVRANCLNQREAKISAELNRKGNRSTFKPSKILVIAVVITLMVGMINIQTVIAFIGGLFYVPGVGLTSDETITTVSIGSPIEIESDRGVLTLRFMSKITRDGRNDLVFYIDAPAVISMQSLPATINAGSETFDVKCLSSGGGSGPGVANSFFIYTFSGFPDITEFDFTIRGVIKHISLTEQGDNYASLSKENNGVTLALHKFPKIASMLGLDIIDRNIQNGEYEMYASVSTDFSDFYDGNGEKIVITGSSSFPSYGGNMSFVKMQGNTSEIKEAKINAVEITYFKNPSDENVYSMIEIPIPKDGETIAVDCQSAIDGYVYKITEVRRDGDTIYYKDNASYEVWKIKDDSQKYQEAIKNSEPYIRAANLGMEDFAVNPMNSKNRFEHGSDYNSITSFDTSADTLKLAIWKIDVIQFGDFNITFN